MLENRKNNELTDDELMALTGGYETPVAINDSVLTGVRPLYGIKPIQPLYGIIPIDIRPLYGIMPAGK